MDARLHAERLDRNAGESFTQRQLDDLPDGAFVLVDGEPLLVLGTRLLVDAGGVRRVPWPAAGGAGRADHAAVAGGRPLGNRLERRLSGSAPSAH